MTWLENLQKSISYIESHLLDENLTADTVACEACVSSFYFQKGFAILTGYSVGEYIRNRKLYLSAIDIARGEKVLDAALKYGWETSESFSKAFSRFHGTPPASVKGDTSRIKVFMPLKIQVKVVGGNEMDYKIEKMESFKVIGFSRIFNMKTSYTEIPKFWDEVYEKYSKQLCEGKAPQTPVEKAIVENQIGMFGICIEDIGKDGNFNYMIAGCYKGGDVPAEMTTYQIPECEWAKFECTGPMPGSLQSVNTAIFNEWLPTNDKYNIACGLNIEWYSPDGKPSDLDYKSAIWIPVKEK